MFRLSFTLDGEPQLVRYLDILADSITDYSSMFEKMADDFRSTMGSVFSNSGAFESRGPWASLSPDYALWKGIHAPGKPILELTGALRASLTGGGNHISQISRTSLKIGTRDPKAQFHQKGTSIMPQRKIIELTQQQKSRWVRIAHSEIFRLMSPNERSSNLSGGPGRR
jgi:phage gpG-like protein